MGGTALELSEIRLKNMALLLHGLFPAYNFSYDEEHGNCIFPALANCSADYIKNEHQENQHKRSGPCQFNLVLIRHPCKIVDQNRQRGCWLHEVEFPTLVNPVITKQRRKK